MAISESARVADANRSSIVEDAAAAFTEARATGIAKIATALHVGGLNSLATHGFIAALQRARLVYADGIAVVMLGKLAGGADIQRAATTDIGVPVIEAIGSLVGRPVRLALVGGKAGLAEAAGSSLEETGYGEVVFATDGYKDDDHWEAVLAELRSVNPDIVLLGLGSPHELVFADRNLHALPPALVMTCGGWFGFLAGEERRAPAVLRVLGVEWIGRLAQDPRRLASRYGKGVFVSISMAVKIVSKRLGAL
ncbi:WecB/TagA/CpsF family glycosyltransferase [Pseudarthrobacter sp. ATCC 49987]|uniref:WecB/TagA/CpsF family glycosyltransferase n=1 Tax=Pseudarthrobacter sp. ATCC 49987 TaxID=2698204 RepID=UPI0013691C9E|nr:WecB/TagA/CpsF family glycosyltransferase [Pseudarthrobacter sp. ATCC 49987]